MATPLHNHTHYSALDGLATPEQIADRCAALGYMACGCTDHDVVAGHVDFYKTLTDKGIKPVLGIETYQVGYGQSRKTNLGHRKDKETGEKSDNFHLILLAINNTGLTNLWAMNTEAHRTGHYYNARVDWELLEKYNEGIVATSACGLGLIQQAVRNNSYAGDPDLILQRFRSIFGDRFYLELSTYPEDWQYEANLATVQLAQTYSIPVVYATDAHYASPEQYELHELTLKMRPGMTPEDGVNHKPSLYIMDEQEIRQHLDYLPKSIVDDAINNSDLIASQSNVTLPTFRKRTPVFIPDKKYKNSKDMFFQLATEGYERKVVQRGYSDEEYLPRFEDEIRTIFQADLVDYFLVVRDYINYARSSGIHVGPGRGSVGGSLVAYLLDITDIDPIRFGLIFERFYNVGREESLPDIDTDFTVEGREKVYDYIKNKYGSDYVTQLPNVLTMQGRAAIQKLGIAMKINRNDTEKISKIIEGAIESGLQPSWDQIWDNVGDKLQPYVDKYPELFENAEKLHGNIFSYGVHASGIIIGDEPLAENYPMKWHAKDKKMVAQWDYRTAEKFGYMKADLLGLRNLDTLDEVNRILKYNGQEPINYQELHDLDHPAEMYKMLEDGLTVGIFQIEDGGDAKRLCKQIKPRNVEDLALITALNRPGPLIAGADKRYVNGRNGGVVTYLHPLVQKVTLDTYGEFIYQEQVINFFRELGYDMKEADNVRSILGKKKRELMQAEMAKYLKVAEPILGAETAAKVWQAIENFSKYAFNKAHSVAYGIMLLRTLYAKYYYPTEFILAGLRTVKKDSKHRYIQEAVRMGIKVLPPELNKSDVNAKTEYNAIRFGYSDVKGIGQEPSKWLVKYGPFEDWDEVLEKAQLDDYKVSLPSGIRRMAINRGHIAKLRSLVELQDEELIAKEEELLGLPLSDDSATILDDHKDEIEAECTPLDQLDNPGTYTIAGIIREIKEGKTRKGDPYARVTVENSGQQFEFAVWNSELQRLRFIWNRRTAVVAQIKVDNQGRAAVIAARVLYRKKKLHEQRV